MKIKLTRGGDNFTALVADRDGPIEGQPVIFFLNGQAQGEAEITDENGRAAKQIPLPRQDCLVEAQIAGIAVRTQLVIKFSAPKERLLHSLIVDPERDGNRVVVYIFAADEAGRGIPDVDIIVRDNKRQQILCTDKNGRTQYEVILRPEEKKRLMIEPAAFGGIHIWETTVRGRRQLK